LIGIKQTPRHNKTAGGFVFCLLSPQGLPAQAAVATAHTTLAPHCVPWHRPPGQVWCSAGEYKVEYEPLGVDEYEARYREQQIKYLQ
jgi:hypothetical protein